MLKKILTSLMILTILVLLALTWYSSRTTEKLFKTQIAAINSAYPQLIQIELDSYQRQLFVSHARTTIKAAQKKIILNHQIRHFLWGTTITSSFGDSPNLNDQLAATIPFEQIKLVSDINFNGTGTSKLVSPDKNLGAADGSFEIAGLELNWKHDESLSFPQFQLTLEKFLLGQNQRAIRLSNLTFLTSSTLENDTYFHTGNLNFSHLDLAGEELRNGRIALKLSGLRQNGLQDLLAQLQQRGKTGQILSANMQLDLLALYTEMLKAGVTITLEELTIETAKGKLVGAGALILQPTDDILGALLSMSNIKANFRLQLDSDCFKTGYRLVSYLSANGEEYHQSHALLNERAIQLIEELVTQGIFAKQQVKDQFNFDFSLSAGEAILNGRALN